MELPTPEAQQRYDDLVAVAPGVRRRPRLRRHALADRGGPRCRGRSTPTGPTALVELAARVRAVVVVTGRPARQVVDLGGLDAVADGLADGARLVVMGQYGNERWDSAHPRVHLARAAGRAARAARRAARPCSTRRRAGEAFVEEKGLALAVHTRRLPDAAAAFDRLVPLLRRGGRAARPRCRAGPDGARGARPRHAQGARRAGRRRGARGAAACCSPATTSATSRRSRRSPRLRERRPAGAAGLLVLARAGRASPTSPTSWSTARQACSRCCAGSPPTPADCAPAGPPGPLLRRWPWARSAAGAGVDQGVAAVLEAGQPLEHVVHAHVAPAQVGPAGGQRRTAAASAGPRQATYCQACRSSCRTTRGRWSNQARSWRVTTTSPTVNAFATGKPMPVAGGDHQAARPAGEARSTDDGDAAGRAASTRWPR